MIKHKTIKFFVEILFSMNYGDFVVQKALNSICNIKSVNCILQYAYSYIVLQLKTCDITFNIKAGIIFRK